LLNEVLGLEIGKPPSDSTFRYLFLQLDVEAFEALLLQWMSQQPGASATFIAQASLYCQPLGVAIAQPT